MSNYITTDTAEASFLMAHGVQYQGIDRQNGDPKTDIILVDNGNVNDLIMKWDTGTCPEKNFFLKYKWLLKQVAPISPNKK